MSLNSRSKRYKNLVKEFLSEENEILKLSDSIDKVLSLSNCNFNSTLELVVNLGINPKYSDQVLRGSTVLPNGSGKKVTLLAFVEAKDVDTAKQAGADIIGDVEYIDELAKGKKIEFDVCFAVPSMMSKVSKCAKVLGTKGLMPNPKLGTVSADIENAISDIKKGRVSVRADKGGIVHVGVGKADFGNEKIKENILHVINYLKQSKPKGAKGVYFKKISLCSTMSPSVEIDVSDCIV